MVSDRGGKVGHMDDRYCIDQIGNKCMYKNLISDFCINREKQYVCEALNYLNL